MNWGIRPTVNGQIPLLEVHIPNFNDELYNKTLEIKITNKIRNEQKFNSIEELKMQIQKDIEICLKL